MQMLNRLLALEKRIRRLEIMVGGVLFIVGTQHPAFVAAMSAFMKAMTAAGALAATLHP